MPDPKPKLVKVQGLGVVHFPSSMPDSHIGVVIKNHIAKNPSAHKEINVTPSLETSLSPELQRIEHAVGAVYKLSNPSYLCEGTADFRRQVNRIVLS